MTVLEPTAERRSALGELGANLALVHFLAAHDPAALGRYRSASERAVQDAGGRRGFDVRIDQVLAGGDMPYQAITVDLFHSGKAALRTFDAARAGRRAALTDIYALTVRPATRPPRIVKALGFLAPMLRRVLGTSTEKDMTGFAEVANPETGPVPETIAALREHDQTTPFYMMNLNKYYPQARYASGVDVSGEQAYNRYAARILPYLVSVGGYPAVIGPTVGLFVGDGRSPLHDDWSDFAMVYYPCRRNFINMMTSSPQKGVHHRSAGLQRAVLMPSSAWT